MFNIISAYAPQTRCSRKKRNIYMRNGEPVESNHMTRKHVDRSRSKWPCRRNKNRI